MVLNGRFPLLCGVSFLCLVSTLLTPTPSEAQSTASDLPEARSLVRKFAEVSGGLEKLKAIRTLEIDGKLSIPAAGIEGDIKIYQQAPDRLKMTIGLGPAGEQQQGYDGKTAWQVGPQGASVLEGAQAMQMKMQASIVGLAAADKLFDSLETIEQKDFEGENVYVVRGKRKGMSDQLIYFSAESGFVVGTVSDEETPFGKIKVTTVMSDYSKIDGGVVLCKKLVMKLPQFEQVVTLDQFQVNEELPSGWNQLPSAIENQLQ